MTGFDGEDRVTWTDIWAEATERLGSTDEVRHIIEAASGRSGASWLVTLDTAAPRHAKDKVMEMIDRRATGEPLQYVVGRWGFRQLDLKVDRRALIPRPETELVAEAAINALRGRDAPFAADLGTGTGAIAFSLAVENATVRVCATDASVDALALAAENLARLEPGVGARIKLCKGSWFEALPEQLRNRFDLIVSNPPYVREDERAQLPREVLEWEPASALFAGDDGLDDIGHIVGGAFDWLAPEGALVVEIAPHQANDVEIMAAAAGFREVNIGSDYIGRKRWLAAKR